MQRCGGAPLRVARGFFPGRAHTERLPEVQAGLERRGDLDQERARAFEAEAAKQCW